MSRKQVNFSALKPRLIWNERPVKPCVSYWRERRFDIDLVHDNVQKELIKEVEIEQGAHSLLVRLLEQVNEQIRLNRKAKYNLEKDLKDKFDAQSIDSHARNLDLNRPDIYMKRGADKVEPK